MAEQNLAALLGSFRGVAAAHWRDATIDLPHPEIVALFESAETNTLNV